MSAAARSLQRLVVVLAALTLLASCAQLGPSAVLVIAPGNVVASAEVGERPVAVLTVRNEGSGSGTVTFTSSDDRLSIQPASVSLVAGGSATVSIAAFCDVQGDVETPIVARFGSSTATVPFFRSCSGHAAYLSGDEGEADGAPVGLSLPTPGDGLAFDVVAPPEATWLESVVPASGTTDGVRLSLTLTPQACSTREVLETQLDLSFSDGTAYAARVYRICASAIGPANYDIDLLFSGDGFTTSSLLTFLDAAERWERLVVDDLADVTLGTIPGGCLTGAADREGTEVDDLLIEARIVSIDGSGGVVGRAGPCVVRSATPPSSPDPYLPSYGAMEFDVDDVAWLADDDLLASTILHEMGHVLGIGTLWSFVDPPLLDFETDPTGGSCVFASAFTSLPVFTGSSAVTEYGAFGSGDVPVEDLYGPGTQCAHWRESEFDAELMTGILESAPTPIPLSRVTVASLADLGYGVDYEDADAFPPASGLGAATADGRGFDIALHEVLITPIGEVHPGTP